MIWYPHPVDCTIQFIGMYIHVIELYWCVVERTKKYEVSLFRVWCSKRKLAFFLIVHFSIRVWNIISSPYMEVKSMKSKRISTNDWCHASQGIKRFLPTNPFNTVEQIQSRDTREVWRKTLNFMITTIREITQLYIYIFSRLKHGREGKSLNKEAWSSLATTHSTRFTAKSTK